MEKRRAGKTDMHLSLFGFGGFHLIEVSSKNSDLMLNTYLNNDGNYIETAADYGDGISERKIGKAVAHRRKDFFLASKCFKRNYETARASINRSLKNLKTDYLDILFIHALQTEKEADEVLAEDGAIKAVLEAKKEGKLRYFGVSGHGRPDGLLNITRRFDFDVCMAMFNYFDCYNYPQIEDTLLPELLEKGTAVLGMKTLADGYLYKNPKQAICYTLSLPIASLVIGINRMDYLEQDLEIINDFSPLSDDEYEQIRKDAPELGNYVCRRCGKCESKEFDPQKYFLLEGLFDRQMNSFDVESPADFALRERLKHWFNQTEEAIKEYTKVKQIDQDRDYSELSSLCPYGIDIDRKLKITHSKLTNAKTIY